MLYIMIIIECYYVTFVVSVSIRSHLLLCWVKLTYITHTLFNFTTLSPARVSIITNGKVTAFFTAASPLSNFFPKDIKDSNCLIWHSNEQKHQHDKCVEFKDDETAGKI